MNSGAPDQVRKVSIELQVPHCGFFGSVRFVGGGHCPAAGALRSPSFQAVFGDPGRWHGCRPMDLGLAPEPACPANRARARKRSRKTQVPLAR